MRGLSTHVRTVPLVALSLFALLVSHPSPAQTLNPIHYFTGGPDGQFPYSGLVADRAGNLYGTASGGGSYTNCNGGCGVVFKLRQQGSGWIFTPLYEFQGGNDGADPIANIVIGPDGSLYGTTANGGGTGCNLAGCGTVFRLRPPVTFCHAVSCPWSETVLYRFGDDHPQNGLNPGSPLTFDAAGNAYGTATNGGSANRGVVYELSPSNGGWTQQVIFNFTGYPNGSNPYSGVIFDPSGNLYGTSQLSNGGVVYELSPASGSWTETTLHVLGGNDGLGTNGGLVFDSAGNLYGGTVFGGTGGGGTVYQLSPSGGGWNFAVIANLTGTEGVISNLALDSAGNLYGATANDGSHGLGTVFKLVPNGGSWSYVELHAFTGGNDGASGYGNPVVEQNGDVFGTTLMGGGNHVGLVYEITP